MCLLLCASQERQPETDQYGISSFVYCRRRPFHPQRLLDAAAKQLVSYGVSLLRSKGFFWVATQNQEYGEWEQVGPTVLYALLKLLSASFPCFAFLFI